MVAEPVANLTSLPEEQSQGEDVVDVGCSKAETSGGERLDKHPAILAKRSHR